MTEWPDIVATMRQRQDTNATLLEAMRDIALRYNGDYVIPYLTDEEWRDKLPPLTPALVTEGIDGLAQRAGSVIPSIEAPAISTATNTSKQRALNRRKGIGYSYYKSKFPLMQRRSFRHLFGFGTMALVVVPDFKQGCPIIESRNPMFAFPDLNDLELLRPPTNVGFVYGRSGTWLRKHYPAARRENGGPVAKHGRPDDLWEVIEWFDDEEQVFGILGPRQSPAFRSMQRTYMESEKASKELTRFPNLTGMTPVIMPSRVTLERLGSQLEHVIGVTDMMAMLQALDIIATEKSIFPDMYISSNEGREPELVHGEWLDGRTGEINLIKNADQIGTINSAPNPAGQAAIGRLEDAARQSAGISPMTMGVQTSSQLRTGRAIDAMMGAQLDMRIAEAQVIMEEWLPTLNDVVLSTFEGYWPEHRYKAFSGWKGDRGLVEFTPKEDFAETHFTTASYPIAGADAQFTNIILGQMIAAGLMSKRSAMRRHPWVEDDQAETQRIAEERMEELGNAWLQQQIAQGTLPVDLLALFEKAYRTNDFADFFDALREAQKDAQEQQAQQVEPEAPELQPGLEVASPAGAGLAPQPSVERPSPSQDNFRRVLAALGAGSRGPAGIQRER